MRVERDRPGVARQATPHGERARAGRPGGELVVAARAAVGEQRRGQPADRRARPRGQVCARVEQERQGGGARRLDAQAPRRRQGVRVQVRQSGRARARPEPHRVELGRRRHSGPTRRRPGHGRRTQVAHRRLDDHPPPRQGLDREMIYSSFLIFICLFFCRR